MLNIEKIDQKNDSGSNTVNIGVNYFQNLNERLSHYHSFSSKKFPDAAQLLKKFKETNINRYLYIHCEKVIKTRNFSLSKVENVEIDSFYVPLRVATDISTFKKITTKTILPIENQSKYEFSSSKDITIDSNFLYENFCEEEKIINLQAGAGYGKSTILKKIFKNELNNGKRIPLFIELKEIKTNLFDLIIEKFRDIDIETSEKNLTFLLKTGAFLIILDAFDEINEDTFETIDIVSEIKSIAFNLNTKIIVSSRPGTVLINDSSVKNFKIKNLNKEELLNIIKKLIDNQETLLNLDEIELSLAEHPKLADSLLTPLLANLFFRIYSDFETLPEDSSEFYSTIFHHLYDGHDLQKSGKKPKRIIREISSKREAELLFSSFSYWSIRSNQDHFKKSKIEETLEEIIKRQKIHLNNYNHKFSDNFSEGLISSTSLIIEDGQRKHDIEYTFIHKSIQEYYAAKFLSSDICSRNDNFLRKKLTKEILTSLYKKEQKYLDLVKYYSQTNNMDFNKYILIPYFESIGIKSDSLYSEIKEILKSIIFSSMKAESNFSISKHSSVSQLTAEISIRNIFISSITPIRIAMANSPSSLKEKIKGIYPVIDRAIINDIKSRIDFFHETNFKSKRSGSISIDYCTVENIRKLSNKDVDNATELLHEIIVENILFNAASSLEQITPSDDEAFP